MPPVYNHQALLGDSQVAHSYGNMQHDSQRWILIQETTFTNWVNEQLSRHEQPLHLENVATDFADGVCLVGLVEVLQKRKCLGKVYKTSGLEVHHLSNLQLALDAMEDDGVKLVNIGPGDIAQGNSKLILGLIWCLILRYQIGGRTRIPPRKLMLAWLQAVLPEFKIKNFTTDWNDGVALSALINYCQPGLLPSWNTMDSRISVENCQRAMETAQSAFGIPIVLSPEDLASTNLDELSGMTYLSYFMKAHSPGYIATLDRVRDIVPHPINNFSTDWNDGFLICQLVHALGGQIHGWPHIRRESSFAYRNAQMAIDAASRLGVEPILSAHEITDTEGEFYLGIMAYVAKLCQLQSATPSTERAVRPNRARSRAQLMLDHRRQHYADQQVLMDVGYLDDSMNMHELEITVLSPHRSKVRAELRRTPTGACVSFLPEHAGDYEVRIYCSGSEVTGSPAIVHVQPSKLVLMSPTPAPPPDERPARYRSRDSSLNQFSFSGLQEPCASGSLVEVVISAQGSAEGTVVVDAQSPSGQVLKCPVHRTGNSFKAEFTPLEVGDWRIAILYDGEHIRGSPFSAYVYDANMVQVYGLDVGLVGHELKFNVDTSAAGRGDLKVNVFHRNQTVPVHVEKQGINNYKVQFTPMGAGSYKIHIYFNSMEVKGSPFILDIVDASSVSVYGENLRMASVDRLSTFMIHAVGAETKDISVTILAPSGKKRRARIVPMGDSTYRVEWKPVEAGEHYIDVRLYNQTVQESPFTCNVGDPDMISVRNMPASIKHTDLGEMHSFEIDASLAGSGNLEIMINGGRVPCKVKELGNRCYLATFVPSQPVTHVVELKFNGTPVKGSPWRCEVALPTSSAQTGGASSFSSSSTSYILQPLGLPSALSASLAYMPYSNAQTAALNSVVTNTATSTTYSSEFSGSGLAAEVIRESTLPPVVVDIQGRGLAEACVGKVASFEIGGRSFRTDDIDVKITSPSGKYTPCKVIAARTGNFRCEYVPTEVGVYRIDLSIQRQAINGSPFSVSTFAPQKVYIDPIPGGGIDRPVQFFVDANEAGKGQMEIAINQGRVPHNIQMKGAGRCLVTFIPKEPGTYILEITFNGEMVRGCPARIEIQPAGRESTLDRLDRQHTHSHMCTSDVGVSKWIFAQQAPPSFLGSASQARSSSIPSLSSPRGLSTYGGMSTLDRHEQHSRSNSALNGDAVGSRPSPDLGRSSTSGYSSYQRENRSSGSLLNTAPKPFQRTVGDYHEPPTQETTYAGPFDYDSEKMTTKSTFQMSAVGGGEPRRDHPEATYQAPEPPTKISASFMSYPKPYSKDLRDETYRETTEITVTRGSNDYPGGAIKEAKPVEPSRPTYMMGVSEAIGQNKVTKAAREWEQRSDVRRVDSTSSESPQREKKPYPQHGVTGYSSQYSESKSWDTSAQDQRGPETGRYQVESDRPGARDTRGELMQASSAVASYGSRPDERYAARPYEPKSVKTVEESSTRVVSESRKIYDSRGSKATREGYGQKAGSRLRSDSASSTSSSEDEFLDRKLVTVHGSGIKPIATGVPTSFQVTKLKAKSRKFQVQITGPSKQNVKTSVRKIADGFLVEYTPEEVGTHKIQIDVDGNPLPDTPYTVKAFDLGGVQVRDLKKYGSVRSPLLFTVDAKDAGFGVTDVVIKDLAGEVVPIKLIPQEPSEYQVNFTPTKPGHHQIEVTFNQLQIKGSPFNCVIDGRADEKTKGREQAITSTEKLISSSVYKEEAKRVTKTAPWAGVVEMVSDRALPHRVQAGNPVSFFLRTQGQARTDVTARVEGPNGSKVKAYVSEVHPSEFEVEFTPIEVGDYSVYVDVNSQPVKDSPFMCRVYDASKITVEAAQYGVIDQEVHFVVNASEAGVGNLEVSVNEGKLESRAKNLGQHRYDISFVPKTTEPHQISIKFNDHSVPGSPFSWKILSVGDILIDGPGLQKVPVGKPTHFILSPKEDLESIKDDLDVVITDSQGEVESEISKKKDGSYRVDYVPRNVGTQTVKVILGSSKLAQEVTKAYDASRVQIIDKQQPLHFDQQASFVVDASKAGAGNMEIVVSVDGENVRNFVDNLGNSRFKVSFDMTKQRPHKVSVKFNDEPVQGCPFDMTVSPDGQVIAPPGKEVLVDKETVAHAKTPSALVAKQCTITGDGIHKALVMKQATFTLDTKGATGQDCNVLISAPDQHRVPVQTTQEPGQEDKFLVRFIPTVSGVHIIELTVDDNPVEGSPFSCNVFDPTKVKVGKIGPAVINKPVIFEIDTKNGGEGVIEVDVFNEQTHDKVSCQLIEQSMGNVYEASFVPLESAPHSVEVKFNGERVRGSPFLCQLIDPANVHASGEGLKLAQKDFTAVFDLYAEQEDIDDSIDVSIKTPALNNLPYSMRKTGDSVFHCEYIPKQLGPHVVEVKVGGEHVSGSPFTADVYDIHAIRVSGLRNGVLGTEQQLVIEYGGAGKGFLDVEVKHLEQRLRSALQSADEGRAVVTFTPNEVGRHRVEISFNGVPIPNSPFECQIADVNLVEVSGENIKFASIDQIAHFVATINDAGRGELDVVLTAPDGDIVAVKCFQRKDGNFRVEFTPIITGTHKVDVTFADQPIAGSPFYCEVFDPKKVFISPIPENLTQVGKESTITVDRRAAGNGELELTILDPKKRTVPHQTAPGSSKGTQEFSFIPQVHGKHQLKAALNGIDVLSEWWLKR